MLFIYKTLLLKLPSYFTSLLLFKTSHHITLDIPTLTLMLVELCWVIMHPLN